MPRDALGLIETAGLIAAIEACDAAAKAAAVIVTSAELTEATFITIKIEGDLGAVQAAVEAGAAAAERVGELVAAHVIPRPDGGLEVMLPPLRYISKYHPEENRPSLTAGDNSEHEMPSGGTGANAAVAPGAPVTAEKLQDMTVSELRRFARTLDTMDMTGREISKANKSELIEAIRKALDER